MEVIYMPEKLKQEGELQGKNFKQCPDCKTDLKFVEKFMFKQIIEDTDASPIPAGGRLPRQGGPAGEAGKCLAVKTKFIICQKCYDRYMDGVRRKRTYIRVFRRDNDVAKRNGAKLDWKLKMWYIAPYATPMQRAYLLNCFQVIEFDYEADGQVDEISTRPSAGHGVDDTDSPAPAGMAAHCLREVERMLGYS